MLGQLVIIPKIKINITSSIPTPSPGSPAFLRIGRGLNIFFSIMLITRSRCGIMTVDIHVGSAKRSLNSCKYPCLSAFYLMCFESSFKSSGEEHAWSFFKN